MNLITRTNDLSREEWLEFRRGGLGGSDAAVVCGLSPYRSKIELWADKTRRLPDQEDNEAMRIGRDLEDYVAKRFCEATGKKVRRHNAMYSHGDYGFIRANVDRDIIGENAGLECKTTSAFAKSDFESGEIPAYYYCQCCHYMNVMGYDRMYLAVLVMGRAFYWFIIERNEADCKALLDAEIAFWNECILPDARPDPDGSESAARTIAALHEDWKDDAISMFEENDTAAELITVQEQKKSIELKEKELKQRLQLALDGNTDGFTADYRITYRPQSRTTVDNKKLKAEHPDIYEKYSNTTTSRVFRISERKD
ncbi:MAG: YqaJ viral recombinase family protein [Oscillospiraceae bacterium]|nr:YqaJ viral recombinase family protein [Oscillospiraceae bacterium]